MSDDEKPEEEPSIEEILDSIRQIISDDDEETPEEEAPVEEAVAEPEPEPEPEPEEDIVELTDKIEEEELEPEPESEVEEEPEPEPEPEIEEKPVEVEMRDTEDEDINIDDISSDDGDILTNAAESAAYDGFEELVKKTAVEHNGITLEEIVRTELKPLLRDWLDSHLPSMIERLVEEELRRVSKQVLGEE